MTEAQTQALDRLPRFYTPRDVVDLVFAGDQDAFVDAWASRDLPAPIRKACEETLTYEQQSVWLLQRILAVLVEGRAALAPVQPWLAVLAQMPLPTPEEIAAARPESPA